MNNKKIQELKGSFKNLNKFGIKDETRKSSRFGKDIDPIELSIAEQQH